MATSATEIRSTAEIRDGIDRIRFSDLESFTSDVSFISPPQVVRSVLVAVAE